MDVKKLAHSGGTGRWISVSLRSGLQSEFQDSQGYIEKPCLKVKKKKKKKVGGGRKERKEGRKKEGNKLVNSCVVM
jgi:hypothetical protein